MELVVRINWLRDHLMVMDESEPDSFESIKEAVCDVLHEAFNDPEPSEGLAQALTDLKRATRARKGMGSALK